MRAELQVKYFGIEDLSTLNDWLAKRGAPRAEAFDLPAVGFIVSKEDLPIAACFLRRCEGNLGFVEGLTSNPDAPSELRHAAIDIAIQCVCDEAKGREMTRLIAWTVDSGTQVRGIERHGFLKSQQTLLVRELAPKG